MVKFSHMIINFFICTLFWAFIMGQDDGYFGGWPINKYKDEIKDPGFALDCNDLDSLKKIGCACSDNEDCYSGRCFNSPRIGKYCLQNKGTVFPRYKLMDQYGEIVDLYDFAGQGKLIVIEFSTAWCQPCRDFAAWLSFDDLSVTTHKFWKEKYAVIKKLIKKEKIHFINIQTQSKFREPSSLESVDEWVYDYPDELIPVFSDPNYDVRDWMKVTAYPTIIVLNDKMEIIEFSVRGWHDALGFLSDIKWDFEDSNKINKEGNGQ